MDGLGHFRLHSSPNESLLKPNHSLKPLTQTYQAHRLFYILHLINADLQHELYKFEQPTLSQLTTTVEITATRLVRCTQASIVLILFSCQPPRK